MMFAGPVLCEGPGSGISPRLRKVDAMSMLEGMTRVHRRRAYGAVRQELYRDGSRGASVIPCYGFGGCEHPVGSCVTVMALTYHGPGVWDFGLEAGARPVHTTQVGVGS